MISKSKVLELALLVTVFLVAGCNDTLRQFITPVPQPGGDPCTACLSHAVVLSQNPAGNGSDMHIDVTGDTAAGIVPVGPQPQFIGKNNNRVFILNSDNTITSYIGLLSNTVGASTVTEPGTVSGPVAGGTSSTGNFFVTNRTSNNLSVISASTLAITTVLPVGTEPVAVIGSAANSKIYVVNHNNGGAGSLTVISTTDNTVTGTINVGTAPIWGVMAPDGAHIFVVNQGDGTVSCIDTLLDLVIATIPVGASSSSSPNFAVFDPGLQRVYISNTGESSISVIKANDIDLAAVPQVLPRKIADIKLTAPPTSVTVLPDGSHAYAALGGCPAGTNHTNILDNTHLPTCNGNLVSVIDPVGLREASTINVGAGAVSIDAARDSSRVFVVAAHDTFTDASGPHPAGTVSIIHSATNTLTQKMLAPQQDFSCVSSSTKFCATQVPFMVRVIP